MNYTRLDCDMDVKCFRDLLPCVRKSLATASVARGIRRQERRQRISIDPEYSPILIMGATRQIVPTYPRINHRSHLFAIRAKRKKEDEKSESPREATRGDCERASGSRPRCTRDCHTDGIQKYRATRIYPTQTFARRDIERY